MWSKIKLFFFLSTFLVVLSGCIENDIPYAKVPLYITEFEVEGQVGSSDIDKKAQRVKVVLEENVNPAEVKLNKISYFAEYDGDTAYYDREEVRSSLNTDMLDLRDTLNITLSLYQDYLWVIAPEQPIARKFAIAGQIGNPEFDIENKIALAYVSKTASLKDIKVKEIKLAPLGAFYNGYLDEIHALKWTEYSNYSEAKVNVKFKDFIDEEWTLRVTRKTSNVLTLPAHPWVNVAWLHGTGVAETECRFEYRELDATEWKVVSQEKLTINGADFTARVSGLKANTTYEYKAFSGGEYADPVQFTTTAPQTIPNMDFEDWSEKGKVVCPWAEGADSYWDCGNWGSNTVGKNNITNPDTDRPQGTKGHYAAKLETKTIFGVLATGNLFIGKYKETKGMNGLLGFGRPFTTYPTRLTGFYKYKNEKINKVSNGYDHMSGQPDSCSIYIALGDWDSDGEGTFVKILTDKGNNRGTYFDVNDPHIIAYGCMTDSRIMTDYEKFEIELKYRTLDRCPTAIIIVCAASKYGDYFVGGVGSTLWVDDFNLEYD